MFRLQAWLRAVLQVSKERGFMAKGYMSAMGARSFFAEIYASSAQKA
jgi:hypothetical protein